MKALQFTDQEARNFYATGNDQLKEKLTAVYGEAFFSHSIIDRVQNFDDILAISGKTMESLVRPGDRIDEIARRKAELIAEVYNEGDVLDPMNTDQYKYYPYFRITPGSGFGLSCAGCDYWRSRSDVGVRLCFKNSSLAIDAGKKFPDIYADMLLK